MMTDQEIFTRVWEHLNKQRVASVLKEPGRDSMCAYRTPDGRMCAVGCLIPDERYHPDMERKTVGGLIDGFPEIRDLFFGAGAHTIHDVYNSQRAVLLDKLQGAHDLKLDSWRGPEENFRLWVAEMHAIADKFGLTVPEQPVSIGD